VSKTHCATRRRQPSLLTASCCGTSQVMLVLFKSCCMVSIQFFRGFPGFLFVPLISQCTACLGSLLSSIRRTCPSHLSLLSFTMTSIFSSCICVCALTLLLLTLSFHEIPIIFLWNLWSAASSFSYVQLLGATILHRITLDITNDSHNLTLSVVLICLFFHTDFNLPSTLLILPILVWQSLSQLLSLII